MIQQVFLFFHSSLAIIVLEIIIILVLLILLIIILKKRMKREKIHLAVQDKVRDDELQTLLLNKYAEEKIKGKVSESIPYEVQYHDKGTKLEGYIQIQIIVFNKFSTQKYVYNMESLLYIGRNPQDEIILSDSSAEDEAQLIKHGKGVYIKKTKSDSIIYLVRKKKKYRVEKEAIQICSGDKIIIGDSYMQITLL